MSVELTILFLFTSPFVVCLPQSLIFTPPDELNIFAFPVKSHVYCSIVGDFIALSVV